MDISAAALRLTPLASAAIAGVPTRFFVPARYPIAKTWTPEEVWSALVYIITDQLQVEAAEVTYHASFQNDLGAD
jgi:hypothetical protein